MVIINSLFYERIILLLKATISGEKGYICERANAQQ